MMTVFTLDLAHCTDMDLSKFNTELQQFCTDNLVVAAGTVDIHDTLIVTLTAISDDDIPEGEEVMTVAVKTRLFTTEDLAEGATRFLGDALGVTYHKAGSGILVCVVEPMVEEDEE